MEDIVLELSDSQILKDDAAKAVLGALAAVAVSRLVHKTYDVAMTAYRLKKAATGES